LQALPEGRKRRAVRYPQWLLLLMAILGILSVCRSVRDLERLAKPHHQAFGAALGLELPNAPSDTTFLYLFERVELEQLFGLVTPANPTSALPSKPCSAPLSSTVF